MSDYLKLAERAQLAEAFRKWCVANNIETTARNLFIFLDETEALNRDKCRELMQPEPEPQPVTDPLTVEGVREIMALNKEQREALEKISEGIESCISLWGTFGRLIDRDTVINVLRALQKDADVTLEEGNQ